MKYITWIAIGLILAACASQPQLAPTMAAVTETAPATALPEATAAPSAADYPAPEQTHMAVVDEYFERGYAVWLKDWGQIWIFVEPIVEPGKIEIGGALIGPETESQVLTTGGPWVRFADTFDPATDVQTDPALTPPPGMQQPKGGIGKIWRANKELQAAMGWALDWERPHKTFINSYAIGVLGKGEGFVQTGRLYTIYASDGALFYVHEEAGIWSRP